MGAAAALQLHRRQMEVSIAWGLSARLLIAAVVSASGISYALLALFAALVVLAGILDGAMNTTGWITRDTASQGVCVGATVVPAVVLALHLVLPSSQTAALFSASLAAAFAMMALQLGLMFLDYSRHSVRQQQQQKPCLDGTMESKQGSSSLPSTPIAADHECAATAPPPQPRLAAAHYCAVCSAFVFVTLLDALPSIQQQQLAQQARQQSAGAPVWARIHAATAAAVLGPAVLVAQLVLLPGCFTFGEALSLAQGWTCLALASWQQLTQQQPSPPWAFPAGTAWAVLLQQHSHSLSLVSPEVSSPLLEVLCKLATGALQLMSQLVTAPLQLSTRPAAAASAAEGLGSGAGGAPGTVDGAAGSFIVVLLATILLAAACLAGVLHCWQLPSRRGRPDKQQECRLQPHPQQQQQGQQGHQHRPQQQKQPEGQQQRQQRPHHQKQPEEQQQQHPQQHPVHGGAGNMHAPAGSSSTRVAAAALHLLLLPGLLLLLALAVSAVARLAAWTLLVFLPQQPRRWMLLGYWLVSLGSALPLMRAAAVRAGLPQIILRKGYHLLAALLFVPVFFLDRELLCVSLAVAFAALVATEAARCCRVPVLGRWVHEFMVKFVDERDGGVVYVTHFTLLLGLAIPMWLTLWVSPLAPVSSTAGGSHSVTASTAGIPQQPQQQQMTAATGGFAAPGWGTTSSALVTAPGGAPLPQHQPQLLIVLLGLSGMVIIGVGDTMAAYFGKLYGSRPIHIGSNKTLEGTLAGACSSVAAWLVLLGSVGMLPSLSSSGWVQLVVVTAAASLLEACTTQLDNLMIPLWYLPQVLLIAAGR